MTATPAPVVRRSWSEIFEVYEHVSTPPGEAWRLVSTLRALKALACSTSASAVQTLALARTANRYQRRSGSTLLARLRNDLLKCRQAAERGEVACRQAEAEGGSVLTSFLLRRAGRCRVLVPNGVWLARRCMVRRSAPPWLFRIRPGGWIPGTQVGQGPGQRVPPRRRPPSPRSS